MRRVISLWLPRFATERRRRTGTGRPSRPLALVADEGGRRVLAAVDARAAAAGLAPGLPLAQARAQVPDLACAPADADGDGRALARLAAWCGRYSPWVAPDRAHEAGGAAGLLLDVTGCAHLFGGEAALLADLRGRVEALGFTARAGLAGTPGGAWALARFAAGPGRPEVLAAPGELRAALAPLPPAALRLGAAEAELLARLGLATVGALAEVPAAALAPRVGPAVARRLDQALGRRAEPISPQAVPAAHRVRRAFAEPVTAREALAAGLGALAAALCRDLEAAQEGARRLELVLYRVNGTLQAVTLGTSRPSREADHLKRLLAGHLERLEPGFGVEVMTLAARAVEPLSALQLALPEAAAAGAAGRPAVAAGAAPDLARLIDRLTSRLGAGAVRRPQPRESHLPERAAAAGPPLAVPAREGWPRARPPRPLRLLARPRPIEATALLPDHPPAQLGWRRLRHRVVRAEGPERIAPEWWRHETTGEEAAGGEATRDYFRVETADGRRYWVYRSAGRWYLHGLFA